MSSLYFEIRGAVIFGAAVSYGGAERITDFPYLITGILGGGFISISVREDSLTILFSVGTVRFSEVFNLTVILGLIDGRGLLLPFIIFGGGMFRFSVVFILTMIFGLIGCWVLLLLLCTLILSELFTLTYI